MKTVVCLLAIGAFAAGIQMVSPSISSNVESFIREIQKQMPCGFPKLSIPPLAPFIINEKDINIDSEACRLNGTVKDLIVKNLNIFEIVDVKINAVKRKFHVSLDFENISVATWYDLKLFLKKFGFTINMIGAGRAKYAINNFKISGSGKYLISILTNKLKLKSLDIRVHMDNAESDIKGILGDGPVNRNMNEFLEDGVPTIVNENEDLISETIESIILPIANEFLNKYSLNDLITIVGGGGGGGETVTCEPISP